jgi:hypothetical protein
VLKKPNISLSKTLETLIIHSDTEYTLEEKKYNLILSPSFYWLKREEVGLAKLSQAKKIAASIFVGHIPYGEYKYITEPSQESGTYLYYAYNDQNILERLEKIGVHKNNIGKIYFAQQLQNSFEKPVKISEQSLFITQEGLLSVAPLLLAPESDTIDLYKLSLPKKAISISTFNSNIGVDAKSAWLLSGLFFLLSIVLYIESIPYTKALTTLEEEASLKLTQARLPSTNFQLDAIKKGLHKKAKKSAKLNTILEKVIALPHKEQSWIEELTINHKAVIVLFNTEKDNTLQSRAEKAFKKAKISTHKKSLTLEIKR